VCDTSPVTICQEDIFFRCGEARLKLRSLGADRDELIRYERKDIAAARYSRYLIARTLDPQVLQEILTKTLRVTSVVKKTRILYLIGQTRVHIDEAEGLGILVELEVVVRHGQSEVEGKTIAEALMAEFGIDKQQQVFQEGYVDLLACRGA
jgi:predicted adenylyl cyclase CyaB